MFKIGLVGNSVLVENHIDALKKIHEVDISGIYDPENKLSSLFYKKYHIAVFKSFNELIENSTAIDIISIPDSFFKTVISSLIKKTKHLFIDEDVIKNNFNKLTNIYKLSVEAGVIVQPGFLLPFNPDLKELTCPFFLPGFIEIKHFKNEILQKDKNDFIFKVMMPDIFLIINRIKSNLKKIETSSVNFNKNSSILINTYMMFENGSFANITAGNFMHESRHDLTLYQNSSKIDIDLRNNKRDRLSKKINNTIKKAIPDLSSNTLEDALKLFIYSVNKSIEPDINLNQAIEALHIANTIQYKLNFSHQSV